MARFAPILLLALFGAWCGTFAWGATALGSTAAGIALLGMLLWIGAPCRDPLGLGAAGSLLPWALWITLAASLWASPVPRAGRVGLVLFPVFLWLPGAVARCWRRAEDLRSGLRGLALVVAAVALWSLGDWLFLGSPRPAMPLGHHNLLAAWLAILLPLAFAPSRESGPWRWAGWVGAGLAVVAIVASRSLAGTAALAVEALLGLAWLLRGRRRWSVLLLVGLLAALQAPRLARIATGEDSSVRSRVSYAAAGWEGFQERPLLGWGPGSTPWTLSAFLEPVLGSELVGDLHSLPLQLAYELGVTGFLLALATVTVFFRRRCGDPLPVLGLIGAIVVSLTSAAVSVTALPVAVAVAAGAALSGTEETRPERGLPVRLAALAAGLVLLPLEIARWHYDRAAEDPARARSEVTKAIEIDPDFPLYRMRLALLQAEAGEAQRAAVDSNAVSLLWTVAGILGQAAEEPWAGDALKRACALGPLDPFPPFYLMLADPSETAPVYGAQALLADPRLAAAVFWEGEEPLFARSLEEVRHWPGVDPGWKEALLAASPSPGERRGPILRLGLEIDTVSSLSPSLTVFRRRPWPMQWPLVQVRQALLDRLQPPPALSLTTTSETAFAALPCRFPEEQLASDHPLSRPLRTP